MLYLPFTDTTLYPPLDISIAPYLDGVHLGFVVGDNDNDPSWGGYYKTKSNYYDSIIKKFQEKNSNLIVSFGGAQGKELATVTESVNQLYAKYQQVICKYKLKRVDFDIEGSALGNYKANSRRALAIHMLKNDNPGLIVSLTVPVMPFGLDLETRKLVDETPADIVNIMAMDYGNEKDMAKATISAIENTKKQIKNKLGVTIMIGENDTGEVMTIKDAQKIYKHIKNDVRVDFVSIWSLERDQGISGPLTTSSKVDQKPWAFSKILIVK